MPSSRTLIIGVGNSYRSDDGAGLSVADKIIKKNIEGVEVLVGIRDSFELIRKWGGKEKVYVVDAVVSGALPGTIHRFDGLEGKYSQDIFKRDSTHSISILDAMELARILKQLPLSLIIFGIEGRNFSVGEGLSPEVAKAVEETAERIARELS